MMEQKQGRTVVLGIYRTRSAVDYAVDQLKLSGFQSSDISVLMPTKEESDAFAHKKKTKSAQGVTTGAASGALLGGGLGWLVGMGALVIPGLGPFIAAGPIMAALAGLGVGGALGGIAGALVGEGIPEHQAKRFEGIVKNGGILLSVHMDEAERNQKAKELFQRTGAQDIATTSEEREDVRASNVGARGVETEYPTLNSTSNAKDDLLARKQF